MNYLRFFVLYFLIYLFTSCNSEDEIIQGEYEFTTEYSTTITVGGVIGITERTFKVGEVYEGTDSGEKTIKIRIAETTVLDKDCQDSWCYQEFLDVPRQLLKYIN